MLQSTGMFWWFDVPVIFPRKTKKYGSIEKDLLYRPVSFLYRASQAVWEDATGGGFDIDSLNSLCFFYSVDILKFILKDVQMGSCPSSS